MTNNRLSIKGGWLSLYDRVSDKFVDGLLHESGVTSEVTPQTRVVAKLGKILSLRVGQEYHNRQSCLVRRLNQNEYEITTLDAFLHKKETYIVDNDDLIEVLVEGAIQMGR